MKLLAVLALLAGLGPVQAETWPAASLSSDRRLLAYALTRDRPQDFPGGWQATVGALVAEAGLSGRTFAPRVQLAPTLTWDASINGGIPSDTIQLGGLTFTVDPDSRAVAGLLPGLSLGVVQVTGLAPGRGLRATASVWGARSDGLAVVRLAGEVCGLADLGAWTFADLCLSHEETRRELSTAELSRASLTVTRLSGDGAQVRRMALRLGGEGRRGDHRPTAALTYETAGRLGLVTATLEGGALVPGWQAVISRQSLGLRRSVLGAPMGVTLAHSHEAGERFFGQARVDDVWSLQAERWMARGVKASVGYQWRASTQAAQEGGTVLFALDLAGLLR
ncbi:hypothetical protein NX862_12760 [Rhodobacter sp. KR11]|uniref:hypothetical protein n=1 Tax=Rhodobacter sp. KR11 TaxID=2974588 RepID=UPI002222F1A1|nr:hypothetical protein [Rhodobacter sp. KR11]MCW1919627.1 hypothetical protein [Rhodobacter sp. KR11]